MGEILRAVLDATCIDSMPVFYSSNTVIPLTNAAASFGDRTQYFQCKQDAWFLMTGYGMFESSYSAVPFIGFPNSTVTTMRITSERTGRKLYEDPQIKTNANGNFNNWRTLPEYWLWEPSDLIKITETIQLTIPQNGVVLNKSFVMVGIEYRMPEGKGYANGSGF